MCSNNPETQGKDVRRFGMLLDAAFELIDQGIPTLDDFVFHSKNILPQTPLSALQLS